MRQVLHPTSHWGSDMTSAIDSPPCSRLVLILRARDQSKKNISFRRIFCALISYGLLASSPAMAQASTCQWVGQVWTCNQAPEASKPLDYGAIINAGRAAVPAYEPRQSRPSDAYLREETERLKRQRQGYDLRAKVGRMVGEGDCQAARKAALSAGDFDLAKQVDELCQP